MKTIRVASCQVLIEIDDPVATRRNAQNAVETAVAQGAKLVVLPELANSGYCFVDKIEAIRKAETTSGPWTSLLIQLSRQYGIVIVAGFAEQAQDSAHLYSSAAVIDHGEILGIYRKTHLWDQENRFFESGDKPPLIIGTSIGTIAVAVCYDIEFPEIVRFAAESKADILAAPVNWPTLPKPLGMWPIEIFKAMANSAAYRIPIAVADRCGTERGVDWTGGSVITGGDGYPLAVPTITEPSAPAVLVVDVPITNSSRLSQFNDAHLDRKPELYGSTLERDSANNPVRKNDGYYHL